MSSLERIKKWNLHCDPVLTFDPAFELFAEFKPKKSSKKTLVLIPRHNSEKPFEIAAHNAAEKKYDEIRILLMQPSRQEFQIASNLRLMLGRGECIELDSVEELMAEVGSADFVLSERFHGALAALAMDIPFSTVFQKRGDKLDVLGSYARGGDRSVLQLSVQKGSEELLKALSSIQR